HDAIAKISAFPIVTPYSVPYNAAAHTATGSATGVDAGGAALGTSFTLTGTTHTNAGDYPSDAWSFDGGTNYISTSGTVHDAIAKISASPIVTPYSVDYNAAAHTATGSVTGVDAGGAALGTSFTLTGTT